MSVFIGSTSSMKAIGKDITIPNRDVNKLSYYLHCATKSCGVDLDMDDLLDYQNVHKLPSKRQDLIFLLAFNTFDLETVVNKTIFFDSKNEILSRKVSNEFYELEKVQTILAVEKSIMIGGQQKQVRRIMVFNEKWITKYYVEPLKQNQARLRQIITEGTKNKDKSPTVEDALSAAFFQVLLASDKDKTKHCSHCRGLDGVCGCEHGCAAKVDSQCQVVHTTITCDLCMTIGIKGARYNCRECYNFDLCERCYESGQHAAGTHSYHRLARVGSNPVYIQPKKSSSIPAPIPPTSVTPDNHKKFDRDVAVPIVDAVVAPSFQVGQTVRLKGLVQKPEHNGRSVLVVHDMGSRVVVSFPDDGTNITVKVANLEAMREICIPAGTVVEIHGIAMDATLNGKLGVVVDISTSASSSSNRIRVHLLNNKSRILSLKPENVKIVEDES